jgi:parvulin-like peptidyl-prolyl isomerase
MTAASPRARRVPPLALALLALALLPLTAGPARAQKRVTVDRAQIIVNNKIMTMREVAALKDLQRKELQARLKGEELQEALKSLDKTVTEKIVENLLLEIRAEELGISVNDKEIDQRVEAITRRDPGVTDVYTEEQLKDLVYKDVLRRQVMQREVGSRVRVEDADVKRACQAAAGDNRDVEVGHILVKGQDEAALAKARAIRQQLLGGADFEREAVAKSEDPSVSVNKGRLGFISRGQFVKEFEDQAFAMKPGELSEPVRTPFGWHIIRVFSERRRALTDCNNMDDSTRQRFFNDVYNQQSEQRMTEFLDQVRKKADIRVIGS